jgi:hypothetical protein
MTHDDDQLEHERLADEHERDADQLDDEGDRVDRTVEEAKGKVKRAADDPFVATPAEDEPDESGPESDYPTKD